MSTMLVRFATLAFLLFGCSSPTNGVVAADNIAVVGGVQEDNEIDGFARKVNSPTTAAAGGASASHGEVMGHHQHPRELKEGKGNHRQAMKNDEGHRSLGLFDSKSTKVAPDEMDLELFQFRVRTALERGHYGIALDYVLTAMKQRQDVLAQKPFYFQAAFDGVLSEKGVQAAFLFSSMDEEEDNTKKSFIKAELEGISGEVSKTCKEVAKAATLAIDDAVDAKQRLRFLQAKGDCSHATYILGFY